LTHPRKIPAAESDPALRFNKADEIPALLLLPLNPLNYSILYFLTKKINRKAEFPYITFSLQHNACKVCKR